MGNIEYRFFAERSLFKEKEEKLIQNLIKLQIDYVDSLIKNGLILKNEDIASIFAKHTYVVRDLVRYRTMIELNQSRESSKLAKDKDFNTLILNQINNLYSSCKDSNNEVSFKEELFSLYETERVLFQKYNDGVSLDPIFFSRPLPNGIIEPEIKEIKDFGILNINKESNSYLKSFFEGSGLKINEEDEGFSVHFNTFWKNPYRNDKPFSSILEAFGKISKIIEKDKKIKYVFGKSWFLSNPLSRNLGFKIFKEIDFANSYEIWGQFIDKDGNFKKEEAENLVKTGKFKFNCAYGYITREDFLKKFNVVKK